MNKEWWINPKFIKPQDAEHWEAHTDFDIPAILAEHSKLIVEMLEGMKDPENGMYHDAVLDKAIKKIREAD